MPEASHIVCSIRGNVRYASVMRSIRTGRGTRKELVLYLGRVLDAERGIYKNRERGVFAFDLKTMTFSPAPEDLADTTRRETAREGSLEAACEDAGEERIVDFGDAFLFDQLVRRYGLAPALEAMGCANPDSLRALVLCSLLAPRSIRQAQAWLEGSFARFLYPEARLAEECIADLLADMGREEAMQCFFQAYLALLDSDVREGAHLLIEMAGSPGSVHDPLHAAGRRHGLPAEELRLVCVVEQGSGLPVFLCCVPCSVMGTSPIVSTVQELGAAGIGTMLAFPDAGFLSREDMQELAGRDIPFIMRCPPDRPLYRDLVSAHADELAAADHLLDADGRPFNGRRVHAICVSVKNCSELGCMDRELHACMVRDMTMVSREERRHAPPAHDPGHRSNVEGTAFSDEQKRQDVIVLLSTHRLEARNILSACCIRQELEHFFALLPDPALLPSAAGEDMLRGHLLLGFLTLEVRKRVQLELRGSRYAPDAVLAHMANLHAKVVHNVVIPSAPTRDQKDIFALFRVHPAKQYPLKGKA